MNIYICIQQQDELMDTRGAVADLTSQLSSSYDARATTARLIEDLGHSNAFDETKDRERDYVDAIIGRYIYVYVYICIHIHIYCINIYMYIRLCIYIYIHIYILYIYIYTCVYTFIHIYIYKYIYLYTEILGEY
jgi:hypothetical protein